MAEPRFPLMLRIEPENSYGEHCGDYVWLDDSLVGYRPYDGSSYEEIVDEATEVLARMMRERLGWKVSP